MPEDPKAAPSDVPPADAPAAPAAQEKSSGVGSFPPPRVSSTPPPVPTAGGVAGYDDDPLLGMVLLDRVRIDRPIARGGMGKVYYGLQVSMKRPCAIKVLDPRLAGGGDVVDFTRRFLLEASTAAKLTHPNVVTIFDYGETADGRCFIAMEYLEGRTLSEELKKSGKLSAERAIHVTRQVARALREAHALGVVHRDMKPGNVFLLKRDDDDDFAKVLDFGLVKETTPGESAGDQTQVGQIMGSPRYMAPEQVQGKAVDARTDVYSVGAMFYAMLAGHPPFDKATDLATMMAQVSDAPPPIQSVAPDAVLPPGVEAIVMKCLAKNPDDRFASMEELIAALKLRPGGGTTTSDSGSNPSPRLIPPAISYAASPPPWRGGITAWVIALLAVSVAATLAFISRERADSQPTAAVAPPSALPAPQPQSPPPPPPAPKPTATLHIETDPPGAKVKEEGETMCEATPCDIIYTGDQADPTYEHLLSFYKSDYKLERKLVKVSASPFAVKMTRAR
jgi:serine/threonine protein kinase